jgi:hypothetical protein
MLRLVAFCGVVQAGLACQTSTTPRLLRGGVFFDFMLHPVHLLHWKQLAGPNRCRLRLKLSKNEGVPSRTPYGECGEPLHEDWIFFVRY